MGKQICFFASNEDISALLLEIKKGGGIVINENGHELTDDDLKNFCDENFRNSKFKYPSFFVKLQSSKLVYEYFREIDRKSVDELSSEVIQFETCRLSPYHENWYEHGRFWFESSSADEEGKRVKKSKDLANLFNGLSKFIKSNYRLTADKFAYIGPDAYSKYQSKLFIPCSVMHEIRVE